MPVAESYKDGWARVRRWVENRTWIGIYLEGFVRTLPWTSGAFVQIQPLEGSSPQAAASETNSYFLFGLDKGLAPPPPVKLQDPTPPPTIPDVLPKDYSVRSDPGLKDCHVVGDPVVSLADFQRQIQMEQSSGDNGWFNGQIEGKLV